MPVGGRTEHKYNDMKFDLWGFLCCTGNDDNNDKNFLYSSKYLWLKTREKENFLFLNLKNEKIFFVLIQTIEKQWGEKVLIEQSDFEICWAIDLTFIYVKNKNRCTLCFL